MYNSFFAPLKQECAYKLDKVALLYNDKNVLTEVVEQHFICFSRWDTLVYHRGVLSFWLKFQNKRKCTGIPLMLAIEIKGNAM